MRTRLAERVAPWLEKVSDVAPIARLTADWSETHSRPADPLVDALRKTGLFRLVVPGDMGGGALSPWEIGPIIEAMARIDGSAGWTLALGQGLLGQLVRPEVFREVFSDPELSMAGSLNPTHARAIRVEGGYRYSGRGSYVSGCTHASWMLAAGIVVEDGAVKTADGAPVIRAGVLSMKACTIRETWNVLGMRGTGSHDVEFNDIFVPDDLTFSQADALANLGASLAPVALGVARHALEAFVELASAKKPAGGRDLLCDRATAQAQLGEAEGLLQAARSFFYETMEEAEAMRRDGRAPDDTERARRRLGSVMAAQLSARAVDLIYDAAGLTGAANDCAIGRCWRDVHVLRQHITIASTRFEVVGRVYLGMPPGSPLI